MTSAVDRLAAELMKLSDDEWGRVADQDKSAAFGPAWEEFSERLAPPELTLAMRGEQSKAAGADKDETRADAPLDASASRGKSV